MTRKKTPSFSVEQIDWLLSLVAWNKTTIDSTINEHIAEVVKRDLRISLTNIKKEQHGYV